MDRTASDEGVNVDWTTDDELEILSETVAPSQPIPTTTGNEEASSSTGASRRNLINRFVGMGFSEKMVLKAIEEYGEEGTEENILNTLLTYQTLEDSPQERLGVNSDPSSSSGYNETFPDDLSDMDSLSDFEEELQDNTDNLSEKHKMLLAKERMGALTDNEEKLLALVNMGYTMEESSIAIDRHDPGCTVSELTEFIGVAQMARELDCYLPVEPIKPRIVSSGSSNPKKRKLCKRKEEISEETIRLPKPMIGYGVPSQQPERIHRSLPEVAKGPPYFYYENVALAPKGVWDKITRFLYDVQPEFVDSKYFSACARKRGYIHNLPIENRFPLMPLPPQTISAALPLSKKWWPSWDTRTKLNCIQTAIGSARLTERIRSALERYEGVPPDSVQKFVMDQCKKWNLVWVGRNKVAPLEPDEVETLLGFPKNHTRGGGISRTDRYKSLGNSFQVDTVAYHLSVLKDMFPDGLNMLSLFSGIGGAEVALHRLGVKLNNVVSVEKSKVNRDIVRSWWEQTNQQGMLMDFDDVRTFDAAKLEGIMESIGGFDLIIGGSPCNNLAGSNRVSRDGLEGTESSLFYDYFRILDTVKSLSQSR